MIFSIQNFANNKCHFVFFFFRSISTIGSSKASNSQEYEITEIPTWNKE